jgi:glycosyltransferase involved in cell wall biosynthesis
MKIAYVTNYDALDINAWSGSGYNILQALKASGFQTETIGNLSDKGNFLYRIKKVLYSKILSKNYHREREPALLKHYATQVESTLASINCDIVFSPGSLPIAYLQTEKPIVFWTDATFAGMIDFYPSFSNLCIETIKKGNEMEQLALSNCRLAIYTSEWAANTAIQNYDVDPEKIKVVSFGANIDCNRNLQDIDLIIKIKNFEVCKLLFIGVDWFRKGGDFAFTVAYILNKRGIPTELHVVGCNPPARLPGFVIQHGFVSKKTEEGRVFLDKLMMESHFLILPSLADCVPVVFAEASSFGLPCLATNVGGIPTAIHNGKNGMTFPLNENPEIYCDYIEGLLSSKQEYNELALSSFREYIERMTWSTAGEKVYDLVEKFCS